MGWALWRRAREEGLAKLFPTPTAIGILLHLSEALPQLNDLPVGDRHTLGVSCNVVP